VQVKAQKNQETLLHHVNAEETSVLQTSKTLEGSKILYILVQDDPEPEAKEGEQGSCHRYTRPLLTSTLQLMGCKLRHAIKVCTNRHLFVLVEWKENDFLFHEHWFGFFDRLPVYAYFIACTGVLGLRLVLSLWLETSVWTFRCRVLMRDTVI